ncbi:MAG: hypothetical protein N2385_14605, partial [Chloroflexus sp.]|nr:hypothetical protein [Chloroflexus sp.]
TSRIAPPRCKKQKSASRIETWVEGPRGCLVWGTSLGDVTTIRAPLANPLTVEDRSGLLSCPVSIWYVPTTLCRGPACPEQPAADAARAAGAGLPAGADLSRTLRDVLNMPLVGWILAIVGGGLLGYAWLRSLMDFIRPLLWRPDETIDEEWDLYEHLENEGLDKETASRIASNWRHRDDDE